MFRTATHRKVFQARPLSGALRQTHNMCRLGLPEIRPVKAIDSIDWPKATSGDHCTLGTDNDEYRCVDTNPSSVTQPYEHPRDSGRQLRYGCVRDYHPDDSLEALLGIIKKEVEEDIVHQKS
ncbi:hypothetical protein CVT26_003582 [Gymnopilus dilepis]|uniref:Uncharacterized protein n=1 Tax=Gymnopilus dilepis TaxID=231916 RepID=A0A409VS91_9AGAR|nr:hypothetical protein CVT26_003582 [Gymnopilus dilepis]